MRGQETFAPQSLIVGGVFSLRAMTSAVAANVTSETSQLTKFQTNAILPTASDDDVKLGTKNIANIKAGDLVLACDEHSTAIGWKPVKETYQRVSSRFSVGLGDAAFVENVNCLWPIA